MTAMHPRAVELIGSLKLVPHPEGGHYREVYRSAARVRPCDARSERPSLTTIYFLLASGEISRWHRVASDEVWHFYEGDVLELFTADASFSQVTRCVLGPVSDDTQPVHVVRADQWQAARPAGAFTLVGCTVAPGFEFGDFELLRDRPGGGEALRLADPELTSLT